MIHFDLPQKLQDMGGWTNPLISEWFGDYATVLYNNFGSQVKTWLTINEPLMTCYGAYNGIGLAPDLVDPDRAAYICNKNLLLAHATAYRIYENNYKDLHQGKVSIPNQIIWLEGETEEDTELANLAMDYAAGLLCHPIYSKEGGWPPAIDKIIAERSGEQWYLRSRLPKLTTLEKKYIQGTYDFFGLNHYYSNTVRKAQPNETIAEFFNGIPELGAVLGNRTEWLQSESALTINPQGIRNVIAWLRNRYDPDMEIFITENGYGSVSDSLTDDYRVDFLKNYLEQLQLSITEDKANVTGYTAWSLMDNFEWAQGYSRKFGLYNVNFNDTQRVRTPRASALYYSRVQREHSWNV